MLLDWINLTPIWLPQLAYLHSLVARLHTWALAPSFRWKDPRLAFNDMKCLQLTVATPFLFFKSSKPFENPSKSQVWQTTYAALTAILLIDAVIAPTTRFSRPARPIILVLRGPAHCWFWGGFSCICLFQISRVCGPKDRGAFETFTPRSWEFARVCWRYLDCALIIQTRHRPLWDRFVYITN